MGRGVAERISRASGQWAKISSGVCALLLLGSVSLEGLRVWALVSSLATTCRMSCCVRMAACCCRPLRRASASSSEAAWHRRRMTTTCPRTCAATTTVASHLRWAHAIVISGLCPPSLAIPHLCEELLSSRRYSGFSYFLRSPPIGLA